MFILPSAIATAIALATTSKLVARGVSPKVLIVLGTVLFCYSMWQHNHFTTESGAGDFFWPLVLRGLGLGMVFVPLNNLAMSNVEAIEIPGASGLYNLTRMLGGSVGIATAATSLGHLQQSERLHLVEHLAGNDPAAMGRLAQLKQILIGRGIPDAMAQIKAYAVMNMQVEKQVTMLAFAKLFLWFGVILACALPLLALMRHNRYSQSVDLH